MQRLLYKTDKQKEYLVVQKNGIARLPQTFVVHFWDLVGLNLIFLGYCIPIVTIPAALTAMTRITIAMIDDEQYKLWADFFRIFKEEFRRALLCGWTFILTLATACYGIWFYFTNGTLAGVLYIMAFVLCLILILLVGCAVYIFPMLALTDLVWGKLLKNALLLSLVRFFPNIPLSIFFIISLLGSFRLMPLTLPLVVLLLFSSLNLVTTFFAKRDIDQYVLLNKTV